MRILGLDLGSKTIGVAVSDEARVVATPLRTLSRKGGAADREAIRALLAETGAVEVLLGLPVELDGNEGLAARRVRAFGEGLRVQLPQLVVDYWDERFSTASALRALIEADVSRKKRKEVVDHVAASLILQSYLDARRGAKARAGDATKEGR